MVEIVQIERTTSNYWITVVTQPKPDQVLCDVLGRERADSLITQLAMNPEMGKRIANSGGLRQVRVAVRRTGAKRGSLAVVYLFYDLNMPLFILSADNWRRKQTYSAAELECMRQTSEELVNHYASDKREELGMQATKAG